MKDGIRFWKNNLRSPAGLVAVKARLDRCVAWPFRLLLLVLMVMLMLPPAARAQFTYTVANGAATITGYTGAGGDLVIPGTVKGVPVTQIGERAFQSNSNLTAVVIQGEVTAIGDFAFAACPYLRRVVFGSELRDIGNYAFASCGLLKGVIFPENVTTIGSDAFLDCRRLREAVIPNRVTAIGSEAFLGCDGLTNLTLGQSVSTVGNSAFAGCTSLPEAVLPDSVVTLGSGAFENCGALTNVSLGRGLGLVTGDAFLACPRLLQFAVHPENASYASVEGILYNKSRTLLIRCPPARTGGLGDLPESLTAIGDRAFDTCERLTDVTLPPGVTTIGVGAFQLCGSLHRFILPTGVTAIADQTFFSCSGLTNVSLPDGLVSIGARAFQYCTFLGGVALPAGVSSIGDDAFDHCPKLAGFEIGAGNGAYAGVDGVLFNSSRTRLIQYPAAKTNATCELPDSVTEIGAWAFAGCSYLAHVTVPERVTVIGPGAFSGCTMLGEISLPPGVGEIAPYMFAFCDSLTNTVIPDGVRAIGDGAFQGCQSLVEVTIPNTVTNLASTAFDYCPALANLDLAAQNETYASTEGVLFNRDRTRLIRYPQGKAAASYNIPAGTEGIDYHAFTDAIALTEVALPESLTGIGDYAFYGCSNLLGVSIPAGVSQIGYQAFDHCAALSGFAVDGANSSFSSTDGVLLGRGRTELVQYPPGKPGRAYTLPSTVASVRVRAFGGCTNLQEIGVEPGQFAYASMDGVLVNAGRTELVQYPPGRLDPAYAIPEGITVLDAAAFADGIGLKSLSIPDGVSEISFGTFQGCQELVRLFFEGDAPSWRNFPYFGTAVTIYHLPGTAGWMDPLDQVSIVPWNPRIRLDAGHPEGAVNPLELTLIGAAGIPLVVDACADLAHPNWTPVSTNTCDADGLAQFSDPGGAGGTGRYYRFRPL